MKTLGLYIHIPFCKKKCDYCDFVSFSGKDQNIEFYFKALKLEIEKSSIEAKDYFIDTIYFGGGTPSYIESKYLIDILNVIKENYNILQNAEITIEVNPGSVTEEKLKSYKEVGINRLSIGLQSTKDRLLKLIGRIHNYNEFLETYRLAKQIRI
ncbi:MAG: radical SAM protein [Clostridia bacterium]|nr:radical SAM protein [Clostridia bacterium]